MKKTVQIESQTFNLHGFFNIVLYYCVLARD